MSNTPKLNPIGEMLICDHCLRSAVPSDYTVNKCVVCGDTQIHADPKRVNGEWTPSGVRLAGWGYVETVEGQVLACAECVRRDRA